MFLLLLFKSKNRQKHFLKKVLTKRISRLIATSLVYNLAASRENLSSGFPTRSDAKRTKASEDGKRLEVSDLGNKHVEELHYLCGENNGTDHAQLICVFVFAYLETAAFLMTQLT